MRSSLTGPRDDDDEIAAPPTHRSTATPVVLEQELRDLWLVAAASCSLFAFSLLLSVIAYLAATNRPSTSSSSAKPST